MLDFLNANSGALTLVFSAIVTISTVAYAVLTHVLVGETRQLRRAETEPALAVYLTTSKHWLNLFDVVIHNHGKGVARNLTWTLSPSRDELGKLGVRAASMALFDGFSQLAPGQQVRSFFGTASDLFKDPPIVPIKVSVTYQNAADQSATAAFILDINQFRGMSEVGRNADDRIAGALEKLERSFKSVVSGGRVSVLVETPEEVRREREEAFARIRADIERGEPPLAAPPEQIT